MVKTAGILAHDLVGIRYFATAPFPEMKKCSAFGFPVTKSTYSKSPAARGGFPLAALTYSYGLCSGCKVLG